MTRPWRCPQVVRTSVLPLIVVWSLCSAPLSGRTVLTVGPDGTYASIQNAIDAAVVGQETEILVQGGGRTYFEDLQIPGSFTSGSIVLFGGWDDSFVIHTDEPETTTIDAGGSRVLDIGLAGGKVEIRNFTLTAGRAAQGAGVLVAPGGNAKVVFRKVRIANNVATSAGDALGGGLWALLDNAQQLEMHDCLIEKNRAVSTGGGLANAGGMGIIAAGTSRLLIEETDIDENRIETAGDSSAGGGLLLELTEGAQATLEGTVFVGNSGSNGQGQISGTGTWAATGDTATLLVQRCAWAGNEGIGTEAGPQFASWHLQTSSMRMRDTGFVQGDSDGLAIEASNSSVVNLVNLTLADHPGNGVSLTRQNPAATITLYNSIAFNNGTDLALSGTVDMGSNLIGVDPLFVDPMNLDYYLQVGSPAHNAGNNSPPGGLSATDLSGLTRVLDGTVDIGVYEGVGRIFDDQFESGSTGEWSGAVS